MQILAYTRGRSARDGLRVVTHVVRKGMEDCEEDRVCNAYIRKFSLSRNRDWCEQRSTKSVRKENAIFLGTQMRDCTALQKDSEFKSRRSAIPHATFRLGNHFLFWMRFSFLYILSWLQMESVSMKNRQWRSYGNRLEFELTIVIGRLPCPQTIKGDDLYGVTYCVERKCRQAQYLGVYLAL